MKSRRSDSNEQLKVISQVDDFFPRLFHSLNQFKIDASHQVIITPELLRERIIPYLKNHQEITSLIFYGNKIESESAAILAEFLKS